MKEIAEFIAILTWIAGIVLAQGWFKALALFPLYAWYLVVEKLMIMGVLI